MNRNEEAVLVLELLFRMKEMVANIEIHTGDLEYVDAKDFCKMARKINICVDEVAEKILKDIEHKGWMEGASND